MCSKVVLEPDRTRNPRQACGPLTRRLSLVPAVLLLTVSLCANAGGDQADVEPLLLAYVDPGSAGFVIVTVLGFLSAATYTLRTYVSRLKDRLFRRRDATAEDSSDDADPG